MKSFAHLLLCEFQGVSRLKGEPVQLRLQKVFHLISHGFLSKHSKKDFIFFLFRLESGIPMIRKDPLKKAKKHRFPAFSRRFAFSSESVFSLQNSMKDSFIFPFTVTLTERRNVFCSGRSVRTVTKKRPDGRQHCLLFHWYSVAFPQSIVISSHMIPFVIDFFDICFYLLIAG